MTEAIQPDNGQPPHPPGKDEEEEKEPVDPALVEKALENVRALVSGNGIKPEDVTLQNFEGEVLKFEAYTTFKIKPQVGEKLVAGKMRGEVVGSAQAGRDKVRSTIEKVSTNPEVRDATREMLERREDLGFAAPNLSFRLDRMRRAFVAHLVCNSCSGSAHLPCTHCQKSGWLRCTGCNGQKDTQCPRCAGTQYLNTPQGRIQCSHCHGRGRIPCAICRQTGQIDCPYCVAGKIACQNCRATGWLSHFFYLDFEIRNIFDFQRDLLPEEVPPLIDELGTEMVTEEHAGITLVNDKEREKTLDNNSKVDELVMPYDVRLPWGNLVFLFKDRPVKANLFGLHPELANADPFIEKTAGRGMQELAQIAQGKGGDPAKQLQKASRFRVIGEAITAAALYNKKQAVMFLDEKYPAGIGEEAMQSLADNADKALRNVTSKSRTLGMISGLVGAALLYAAYYIGPGRDLISPLLGGDPALQAMADLLLIFMGGSITTIAIQQAAVRALHGAIDRLLDAEQRKKIKPKAGLNILWGYLGGLALYVLMIELAFAQGNALPQWYEALRSAFP